MTGHIGRRESITLIGGAAAAWPLAARAQQGERMRRVGVLLVGGPEPLGPFREALGELGYVAGKNIQIEVRSAQGQDSRLAGLAAELVRSHVDVIVAVQTPAAHAAKNATRDIPIVMMAGDPIATGLSRESAEKTKTYFAFRVDVWDGAGDNIVEHVAGVETAVATYWGAVGEDHAAPGTRTE
jgi:ABC transporter substrate binding protein